MFDRNLVVEKVKRGKYLPVEIGYGQESIIGVSSIEQKIEGVQVSTPL